MSIWTERGNEMLMLVDKYKHFTEDQAKNELEQLYDDYHSLGIPSEEIEHKIEYIYDESNNIVGEYDVTAEEMEYSRGSRHEDLILMENLVRLFPSLKTRFAQMFSDALNEDGTINFLEDDITNQSQSIIKE